MTQMLPAGNFTTLGCLTRIRLIQAVTVCQGDIVERIWFFLLWRSCRPAQRPSDPEGADCAGDYRFRDVCITSRDSRQWRNAGAARHGERRRLQFFPCGVASGHGMSVLGNSRITLGGSVSRHEDSFQGLLIGNGIVRIGYGFLSMPIASLSVSWSCGGITSFRA